MRAWLPRQRETWIWRFPGSETTPLPRRAVGGHAAALDEKAEGRAAPARTFTSRTSGPVTEPRSERLVHGSIASVIGPGQAVPATEPGPAAERPQGERSARLPHIGGHGSAVLRKQRHCSDVHVLGYWR